MKLDLRKPWKNHGKTPALKDHALQALVLFWKWPASKSYLYPCTEIVEYRATSFRLICDFNAHIVPTHTVHIRFTFPHFSYSTFCFHVNTVRWCSLWLPPPPPRVNSCSRDRSGEEARYYEPNERNTIQKRKKINIITADSLRKLFLSPERCTRHFPPSTLLLSFFFIKPDYNRFLRIPERRSWYKVNAFAAHEARIIHHDSDRRKEH